MTDVKGQYQKLPPGWDCKYDQATGNCYYINYLTKAMQLEDPRSRYKQLQNERCSNESIAMQPMHGSPYHVYPSNNLPAMRAFQNGPGTNTSLLNMSSSPLLSSRGNLEMSPIPLPRSSLTQTSRLPNMSRRSTIQETSFTNPIDTAAVVNKIQNMFPTASEDHIRLLLKKYMKTIFPKADEMVLLDVLASSDNNVQTTSEKLISMGYTKRDFIPPKTTNRFNADDTQAKSEKKPGDEMIIPLRPKDYTIEEKTAIQTQLKEKYPEIAERIILMALESVNYTEDRAIQILHIVQEEDELQAKKHKAILKPVNTDAEIVMSAGNGADEGDTRAAADESILTVVLKTPLSPHSDDVNNSLNASNKHKPQSITSSSEPSSSLTSALSRSSTSSKSSTTSVPPGQQDSFTFKSSKSSTKITSARNIAKKVAFPSIHLITPTTATTQVILSNSPTAYNDEYKENVQYQLGAVATASTTIAMGVAIDTTISPSKPPPPPPNEALKELDISCDEASTSSASTSASSSLNVDSKKYQTITTKSILAHCNMYVSGINGLLHGINYQNKDSAATATSTFASTNTSASSILEKLKLTRLREKTDSFKAAQKATVGDMGTTKQRQEFKSIIGRIPTTGHSATFSKGADESLLLADYVTWNGANPDMPQGNNQKQLSQGPDASMLSERTYTPNGRNSELCKGARKGLAKGSIYAQLAASTNTNTKNIKCN